MTRTLTRAFGLLVAIVLLVAVPAACGSSANQAAADSGSANASTVSVRITDAGCEPATLELPAGATTFEVKNDGADSITEFEVLDGDRVLGEAENVAAGLSGAFSLTLQPGTYVTYCPGGKSSERGTLTVAGKAAQTNTAAVTAVRAYRDYLERQTAELVTATKAFVDAVKAGNVARAKELYGPARAPYERIEPVAESFGNLDPAIDARAGDIPEASWTGFHPLEQALWVRGSLAGTAALADKLLADVKDLDARVKTVDLQTAQIANGAVELLGEVSKSKVTGEEERYSHIDLLDFEANVDGARASFTAVRPIVAETDAPLVDTIDKRFADVLDALDKYRTTSGLVPYTTLTAADTRTLSRSIDALAEPLSKVGTIVVSAA